MTNKQLVLLFASATLLSSCSTDSDTDNSSEKDINDVVECDDKAFEPRCTDEKTLVECKNGFISSYTCPEDEICQNAGCSAPVSCENPEDCHPPIDTCDPAEFVPYCSPDGLYVCEDGQVQLIPCDEECIDGECVPFEPPAPIDPPVEPEPIECPEGMTCECTDDMPETCVDTDEHPNSIQYCENGQWQYIECEQDLCQEIIFGGIKMLDCVKAGLEHCSSEELDTKRCKDDGFQTCTAAGYFYDEYIWGDVIPCRGNSECQDGVCVAKQGACIENSVRCTDKQVLQKCSGGKWNNLLECNASTEACDVIDEKCIDLNNHSKSYNLVSTCPEEYISLSENVFIAAKEYCNYYTPVCSEYNVSCAETCSQKNESQRTCITDDDKSYVVAEDCIEVDNALVFQQNTTRYQVCKKSCNETHTGCDNEGYDPCNGAGTECNGSCLNLSLLNMKDCSTCKDGYCDADQNMSNGCEAYYLDDDDQNCGACGKACTGEGLGCVEGKCEKICQSDEDCSDGKLCVARQCRQCIEGNHTVTGTDEETVCVNGSLSFEGGDISMPNLIEVRKSMSNDYSSRLDSLNMPKLKFVKNLSLYTTDKMKTLTLPSLQAIGNTDDLYALQLYDSNLKVINFPKLKTSGKLIISGNIEELYMPALKRTYGFEFTLPNLKYYNFDSLEKINWDIEINMAGDIIFPKLKEVPFGIDMVYSNVRSLQMPELTETTSINATHNKLLTKIIMPKIQEFTHDVIITDNPKLTLVDFGKDLYRFGDTNDKGVQIKNNASLPCMSLCYLKDVYYKGNVVGLMSEQQCFDGNKADEACPESGYIDWSKCPE